MTDIAAELDAVGKPWQRAHQTCKLQQLMDESLAAATSEALQRALDDGRSLNGITAVLMRNGISISEMTLRRHQHRQCACFRPRDAAASTASSAPQKGNK